VNVDSREDRRHVGLREFMPPRKPSQLGLQEMRRDEVTADLIGPRSSPREWCSSVIPSC
jgi:hypothetical protein